MAQYRVYGINIMLLIDNCYMAKIWPVQLQQLTTREGEHFAKCLEYKKYNRAAFFYCHSSSCSRCTRPVNTKTMITRQKAATIWNIMINIKLYHYYAYNIPQVTQPCSFFLNWLNALITFKGRLIGLWLPITKANYSNKLLYKYI